MKESKALLKEYENYITEAIVNLKQHKYEEAYRFIMSAITANPSIPEPQNLLGIWYEANGNKDLARKHYRIAYVLNPRYKPAGVNLERVSTIFQYAEIPIDYGEEEMAQNK